MISALFLIMEIHSITNLKAYEQAKNVFNPANIESSSEESFSEDVKYLLVCLPFSLGSIANPELMS